MGLLLIQNLGDLYRNRQRIASPICPILVISSFVALSSHSLSSPAHFTCYRRFWRHPKTRNRFSPLPSESSMVSQAETDMPLQWGWKTRLSG